MKNNIVPDSISSATLNLYRFGGWGDYGGDTKYDLASDYNLFLAGTNWNETWDKDEAQWLWGEEPNVSLGEKVGTVPYTPQTTGWFTYDVTEQVREMMKGTSYNRGFIVTCSVKGTLQSSGNQTGFYSSEYEEVEKRPKLSVTYAMGGTDIEIHSNMSKLQLIQNSEKCNVTVQNVSGRVVAEINGIKFQTLSNTLSNRIPHGIYVLSIASESGTTITKKWISGK